MRTALMILLTTLLVAMLSGCCCFDPCRPTFRVFGQPVSQVVQPPANWCVGDCSVDKDVSEAPAYVTP